MLTDTQQVAVYDWEHSWPRWNIRTFDKPECEWVINESCCRYDVPTPTFRVHHKLKGATWYDPEDHSISLRKRHMNLSICLHESAHAIHTWLIDSPNHEIHGPEWLGIYLWLLQEFGVAPLPELTLGLKSRNLVYRPLSWMSPKGIKKRYPALIRRTQQVREMNG